MQNLSTTHPNAKRRLTTQAKSDLRWWLVFLNNWTGIRLIRQHRRDLHVYTDASGAKGIGAWHGSNAFAIRMPRRHKVKHINWKEAYAVHFSVAKWGQSWRGYRVTFMCDNSAIVEVLNKTTIRGDAIEPLQLIFLAAALFDIEVRSCWLSSEDNWIADAVSRFNLKKLANLQLDQLFFKSTQLQPMLQAGSLNPIQQLR